MLTRWKRNRRSAKNPWQYLLEAPNLEASYEAQLDALLQAALDLLGLETVYLYLISRGGERLVLERVQSSTAPDADARDLAPPEVLPPGSAPQDGRSAPHAPPMELPHAAEHDAPHVVRSDLGLFFAAPLHLRDALLGVIHLGPFDSAHAANSIGERVANMLPPLALGIHQARQTAGLRRRLEAAESRAEASQRLVSSAFGVNDFLRLLLRLAIQSTGTEAGFIATREPESQRVTIRAQENLPEGFASNVDLYPGRGLFDWASEHEPSLVVRDIAFVHSYGLRSVLAVPLAAGDTFLGVFCVANFERGHALPHNALQLLAAFAEQVRLMLDNVPALNRLAQRYLETLRVLAQSADARYPGSVAHSERVSDIAVTLARRMGLAPDEIETVRIAGLLHDVGACGIAESGASFSADLDHPNIGADLIRLALPEPVAQAVRTHHEWHDGWGFPNGLPGNRISPAGRVLAMAEFIVEESTDWGELRPVMPLTKLLAEINQRKGAQFDPDVAEVAINMLSETADRTVSMPTVARQPEAPE